MRFLLVAMLLSLGCNGANPSSDAGADAPGSPDARPPCFETCNVVAQSGCDERCAFIETTSPTTCPVRCFPDGTQDVGEPCAVELDGGIDDCASGGHCDVRDGTPGVCRRLCDLGTCPSGTCELFDAGAYGYPVGLCP